MSTPRNFRSPRMAIAAAAVAALAALAACSNEDDSRTAGEKLDDGVATAQAEADRAADRIAQEASEVKQSMSNAADEVGSQFKDAAITAKVNAEFARDKELNAMRIDVDTAEGHVVLDGSAPNDAARDRAERLARAVDGVVSVDNRLNIQAG